MKEPAKYIELDPVIGTVNNGRKSGSAGRWSKLSARAVADISLPAAHVRVLAVIGIYADRDGTAYPSQETIAGIIGIDRATVCRAIKGLRERGYLDRYRKATSRGRYRNVYQLRYPPYAPPRAEAASAEM